MDGPLVRMAYPGGSMPFPTRMVVVRLISGELFLWSPSELAEGLRSEVDGLGPVRHLVSPNKTHHAHITAWKRARASLERMLSWEPEKVILAHGRPYDRNGTAELRRAFRWLGSG